MKIFSFFSNKQFELRMKNLLVICALFVCQFFYAQTTSPSPGTAKQKRKAKENSARPNMGGEYVTFAQVMPTYPGGETQMNEDISQNITYQENEQGRRISGKVYVRMIVEKDGSITHVEATKSIPEGAGSFEAAEEAVRKLKNFSPGIQNGNPLRVLLYLVVPFDYPRE